MILGLLLVKQSQSPFSNGSEPQVADATWSAGTCVSDTSRERKAVSLCVPVKMGWGEEARKQRETQRNRQAADLDPRNPKGKEAQWKGTTLA